MAQRPRLPERIEKLSELANNMWWAWNRRARDLFRALDYPLWQTTGHNPVRQLHEMSPDRLHEASNDPVFLTLYDAVISEFDRYMMAKHTWFGENYASQISGPVAYFSMEFALHNSLPIYAGGLGVLAGDLCKEASDIGLPLVGVGFMYPQGYFHQRISATGWQEEVYRQLNFHEAPISPVVSHDGKRPLVEVKLDDSTLHIAVWQVRVGRVNIYLLDTDIDENAPEDRQLSARLYTADRSIRIRQEIVLGVGGVRVLRALGIKPTVWHANEGHTVFMMLERVREEIDKGVSFAEAIQRVRAATIFTTHTPVPAGHDVFTAPLVAKYLSDCQRAIGCSSETLLELGQQSNVNDQTFNMTAFGLRMAAYSNAVSEIHGAVSRKMWHVLWPDVPEDKVPITHVTNGVHVPSWVAPELNRLYERYVGGDKNGDLSEHQDDSELWQRAQEIPDEELWEVHLQLKRKLMDTIMERAQKRWAEGEAAAHQVLAMGALLRPEVLTIGFVRRFAEYKRPSLIFRDVERLKRLVKDPWRPIQIVFAGKSHPADFPSKHILQQVYGLASDREFQGRIAFVEDYDMHMARYLVHGVDVWLNCPRRRQEASGTSGMKAALNGVIHMSVSDGWWHEGYKGLNGWRIGEEYDPASLEEEDNRDAAAIYELLEKEVIPLYYDQDRAGVPHGWIAKIKESIKTIIPRFCAQRMLKEYIEQMYVPAAHSLVKPEGRRRRG